MKNIDQTLDNGRMTEEYLDAEIIADNEDPNDAARIAHDVWEKVISGDEGNDDVGDSIWPQVLNQLQEEMHNGLDEQVALEVREIIWEDYVPEWESYL